MLVLVEVGEKQTATRGDFMTADKKKKDTKGKPVKPRKVPKKKNKRDKSRDNGEDTRNASKIPDRISEGIVTMGNFQDYVVRTLQLTLDKMHFMDVTRDELVVTLIEIFKGLEVVVDSVYTVEIGTEDVAPELKEELRRSLDELGINFDTNDPRKSEVAEKHLLSLFKKLHDARLTTEDYLMFGNVVGSYLYGLIQMFTSSDIDETNDETFDGDIPVQ